MSERISRRAILFAAGLGSLFAGSVLAVAGKNSQSKKNQLHALSKEFHLPNDLDLEHFMRLAIEEGKKVPAYPFGALVVNIRSKEIVAKGCVHLNNPLWHGEMSAINACPDIGTGFKWDEVCLFTTGESCPMCQSAIIWSGMPLVVYGTSMPFLQKCGFGDINIRAKRVIEASLKGKCQIIGGVLENECNELFVEAQRIQNKNKESS